MCGQNAVRRRVTFVRIVPNLQIPNPFLRGRERVLVFLILGVLFNFYSLKSYFSSARRSAFDGAAARAASVAYHLDLRTAAEDEIALLPGVGPSRARELVRARDRGFEVRYLRDLCAIRGFGPATLERIRPMLRFPVQDLPP
ncbi:MAG: ComEA family DNA-binding protein [Planctomycetota bacterium]